MSGDDHLIIREVPGIGPVVAVIPPAPEDAPEQIREGISRRRVLYATGVCPCGAELVYPTAGERRAAVQDHGTLQATVEHEDDCPALDATLLPAIHAWMEGKR